MYAFLLRFISEFWGAYALAIILSCIKYWLLSLFEKKKNYHPFRRFVIVREQIAECSEKAYVSLPLQDAMSLLYFTNPADVIAFAAGVRKSQHYIGRISSITIISSFFLKCPFLQQFFFLILISFALFFFITSTWLIRFISEAGQ